MTTFGLGNSLDSTCSGYSRENNSLHNQLTNVHQGKGPRLKVDIYPMYRVARHHHYQSLVLARRQITLALAHSTDYVGRHGQEGPH